MKKIAVMAVVLLGLAAVPALAAVSPFMDVPASHWAYDAVAQLASRQVVSGYPDGAFKGGDSMTRYEMASIVSRAIANIENATAEDLELMKRLIDEFSEELAALGARIGDLEARFGTLDEDLGGWSISGALGFEVKIVDNERSVFNVDNYPVGPNYYGAAGRNNFLLSTYRIDLSRRISETTSFHSRLGGDDGGVAWDHYYVRTQLTWEITLDVGSFNINWENDIGLVGDDGSFVGDWTLNALQFGRDWGRVNARAFIARINQDADDPPISFDTTPETGPEVGRYWRDFVYGAYLDAYLLGANVNVAANEQLDFGALAYYGSSSFDYDCIARNLSPEWDMDILESNLIWGVYAKYRFHPSVELKGMYYQQHQSWVVPDDNENASDTANAWKVILALGEGLLKFTSLQFEYAQMETHFIGFDGEPYGWGGNNLFMTRAWNRDDPKTTSVYGVRAAQTWGDTGWDSWLRFYGANYGCTNYDTVNNYGAGLGYQMNPAVRVELAYDYINFGEQGVIAGLEPQRNEVCDDHLIRLSTVVSF